MPYFVDIATAINTGRRASEIAGAYTTEIVNGAVGTDLNCIHGPAYNEIPISVMIAEKLWSVHRIDQRFGIRPDKNGVRLSIIKECWVDV